MYTAVKTRVEVDLPPMDLAWFNWVASGSDDPEPELPAHRFFRHHRRGFLLRGAVCYHDFDGYCRFDGRHLDAIVSLKNYEGEVDDWIRYLRSLGAKGTVAHHYEEADEWTKVVL